MVPQEQRKPAFIDAASGEFKYCQRRLRLRGSELESIHFEKKRADDKPGALISVNKRMVLDDAGRIGSCHIDDIRTRVSKLLTRTCQGRFEQPFITDATRAAMAHQQNFMYCK